LRELSYYLGTIHGFFDLTTDAAVKQFQTDYFGLQEADGKVGKNTWKKLWKTSHKIKSETRPGKTYLYLTKTKRKDWSGCFILNLEYIKDGRLKESLEGEHVRFARGKQGRDEDREFVSGQCRRTYP
jgi:lysozyme